MIQLHLGEDVLGSLPLVFGADELADLPFDGLGDVVDVLRLDQGLQVVLENAGEVVLQLRAPGLVEGTEGERGGCEF